MSTIFIANPTLQHRELHIRLRHQTRIVRIRAQGQEKFPDELDGALLANVQRQLEMAGAVPASDPKAIRSRYSLLYTIAETPSPKAAIPTKQIDRAQEQDQDVRQELAGEQLEKAGAAAFNESAKVGGNEVSFEITQVDDRGNVRGGVDTEIIVGRKKQVRGRRETTAKN